MNHININPSDARRRHDGDCECGDFKRNLITAIICLAPRTVRV